MALLLFQSFTQVRIVYEQITDKVAPGCQSRRAACELGSHRRSPWRKRKVRVLTKGFFQRILLLTDRFVQGKSKREMARDFQQWYGQRQWCRLFELLLNYSLLNHSHSQGRVRKAEVVLASTL